MSHVHETSTRLLLSNTPDSTQIDVKPKEHLGSWVATLSNGDTIVERRGDFEYRQGEPSPWVRLTYFLGDNDLYLTSLRLSFGDRRVFMPSFKFDRFDLKATPPSHYSLQYHLEAEGEIGGAMDQKIFMDLAAHYANKFAVHYIQDVTGGNDSWVVITDSTAQAPTPRRKDN